MFDVNSTPKEIVRNIACTRRVPSLYECLMLAKREDAPEIIFELAKEVVRHLHRIDAMARDFRINLEFY